MNDSTGRLARWAPRILCIAFAAFLCVFALDVFSMHVDFPHRMLALAMHLIPTGVILLALAVAWNREWIGAVFFPLLAVFHAVPKWGQLHWSGYAVIDGPLVLLGVLFLVSWRNRVSRRAGDRA